MLEHGGNISAAARQFGIPESAWLDLSTGINPRGWPVTTIPAQTWQHLPPSTEALHRHACDYYGCESLLAVAGSQAAIQLLPRMRGQSRVGVVSPTYAEHAAAWQFHQHQVEHLAVQDIETRLAGLDVLVVVNPNNPTGQRYSVECLLDWHQQLHTRGGWLIVDEAFMDSEPADSLAAYSHLPGLIVLRSLGKFFGLAGVRCGFVLAEQTLLSALQQQLGPWHVTGPTIFVASQALQDRDWQQLARQRLQDDSQRLANLLSRHGIIVNGGTDLFQWCCHPQALEIHEAMASEAILTRYFPAQVTGISSLRLGLPGNEIQWQKLERALSCLSLHDRQACRG